MRRALVGLALLAPVLGASRAAASPTARLVYSRAVGAASCPDEDALRRAVSLRVGYDPFFAWAKKTIVARMSAEKPDEFVARVALVDEEGTEHGTRDFRTSGECGELLDAVALAIAIAIDPRSLAPPPAAPAPTGLPPTDNPAPDRRPPTPPIAAPEPESAPRTSAPASGLGFEGSAGAVASVGVAPGPVAGAAVGVAARGSRWSLAIEGRIDAASSRPASGGGSVSSWMVVAGLVPCVRRSPVFVCALGQAGLMLASSEGVADARSTSLAWLAAGGRFGVDVPVADQTVFRVRTDLLADLAPPTFQLNGGGAWTAPRLAASLGGDVAVQFQ